MSNNPRNSNLNEDQNIIHVTESFHELNHSREHKKLLLLYTESESSAIQYKGRRRD